MSELRADIQALRGIAVLSVLAYHAKVPFVNGGYLGVDVFFVLSGYLITSLVARGILEKRFSFSEFYWRRAWRLLPAAFAVFLGCAVAAPWLLTTAEQRDFLKQLIGALSFTGNVALWLQTGYFERAAELKPLLHTWSLAIEEQYYLLLPAAMVLVGPRAWRGAALCATVVSAALCFALVASKPVAVFYLLPARAWELGIGSVVALWVQQVAATPATSILRDRLATLCLAVLGVLLLMPFQRAHPGWATAAACLLTAGTLVFRSNWLGVRAGSQLLAWFGDRSYSLYLVHWPLFAFLNTANVSGGGLPWWGRLSAMVMSVVLAEALYRFVESPFRMVGRQPINSVRALVLVGAALIIGLAAALPLVGSKNASDYLTRLRPNVGVGIECDQWSGLTLVRECTSGGEVGRVLVWGDSFAMHWVPGLLASGVTVMQLTRSSCAPVTEYAHVHRDGLSEHTARICLSFNADVQRMLLDGGKAVPEIVVLASPWNFGESAPALSAARNTVEPVSRKAVIEALAAQIRLLRAAGRRVVILAPPPSPGFDVGRCIERKESRLLSFGGHPGCEFSLSESRQRSVQVKEFLDSVGKLANVSVVSSSEAICDIASDRCRTKLDGVIVYRDSGHLSYEGSVALVKRMLLDAAALERLAR